jgi:hypothetical protein
MKLLLAIPVLLGLLAGPTLSAQAQAAVPPPMPAYQTLPAAQLDQLLGPIALYPDPLVAQILPASTLPAQIVLADRFVTGGGDPGQIAQQPWDASVQAMARYPDVLKYLDDNLAWTTELGQAFLNQQADVMSSIQRLRAAAARLGNLQSSPQEQVVTDGNDIEIVPADSDLMYVPAYQPDQVYYDQADGSPYLTYGIGWPMGAWLNYDFDWGGGNLIFWGAGHPRPANWWHETAGQRDRANTSVWRPNNHPGAVAANRGDRGWSGSSASRTTSPATVRQELAHPSAPSAVRSTSVSRPASAAAERAVPASVQRATPAPVERAAPPASVQRATPAPVERAAPVSRPESNGAFIGAQSSQATRSYSNRGQQSIQAAPRSAPAARPAPSSGGGGGRRR